MEPEIEEQGDGWRVSIPLIDGTAMFVFAEIEQPRRGVLDCELTIWEQIPGRAIDPFTARLNVLSLSGRESIRRHLDDQFGKGQWTNLLNRACQLVQAAHRDKDWSVDLTRVDHDEETRYLVRPFVLDGLPAILFGPGETGKTYLSLALAKAVCQDGEFLGQGVKMGRVLMLDYEATERDVKKRLVKLGLTDFDAFIYWPGRGRPLTEMIPALMRCVEQRDVALLLVDSAALACGADPKDEQAAIAYFNALNRIGVSSVTIAHMTKDAKDDIHPFGSIFWYNSARLVWNAKAADEGDNPKHLGLFCRKSNEDIRHKPVGVKITFAEDGKVFVSREDLVRDLSMHQSLKVRIRKVLSRGRATITGIAEDVDATPAAVKKAIQRMDGILRWPTEGKEYEYGLASDEVN